MCRVCLDIHVRGLVLMLAQCLRRWPNIKTSLFQGVVFAGDVYGKVGGGGGGVLMDVLGSFIGTGARG